MFIENGYTNPLQSRRDDMFIENGYANPLQSLRDDMFIENGYTNPLHLRLEEELNWHEQNS